MDSAFSGFRSSLLKTRDCVVRKGLSCSILKHEIEFDVETSQNTLYRNRKVESHRG